ncbi:MAG TPA: type VI secretion system lipoprotein TssJ [Paracoccaceae bacterium]|nr:type VI secretion system lipoprotein TssJ [Paracoccaceae bacterium]
MQRHWLSRTAALLAALLIAACGAPPPPPPTTVALTINGAADMNNSQPAKIQVLYLASASKFQTSDYYALAQDAAATLGPDLVASDEYLVSPGASAQDQKSFDRPVTHVGVIVNFRDISRAGWRGLAPLKPNAANPVTASVAAASVAVTAAN